MTDLPMDEMALNRRQSEIEAELQVAASDIQAADMKALDTERALMHAKAKADLPTSVNGVKLLAAERELRLLLAVEDEWYEHRVAQIAADYARNKFKALDKESMSIANRANRMLEADKMHARYGGIKNA